MSDVDFSYLDVLPIHPPPEALESLTGYVTRLGDENGIANKQILWQLFFRDTKYVNVRKLSDLPAYDLSMLAMRSHQSVERLLSTTLYHLLRKFGRYENAKHMGRFFTNALSTTLRYCPLCLATARYYRLPWRFLMLNGCHDHAVQLLDCCCHCNERLPLLQANVRIGICARCNGNLSDCLAEQLTALGSSDIREAMNRHADLDFLLSPQSWEHDDPLEAANYIGKRFYRARSARKITAQQMASALGTTSSATRVFGLEQGNIGDARQRASGYRPTGFFYWYVAYADQLGLTLQEILTP